jgi:hypothetical protein
MNQIWRHPACCGNMRKKFKAQTSAVKIMLTVFFDHQRLVRLYMFGPLKMVLKGC